MIRKQFTISGKVQGVWFRASTREQALLLALSGYAGNLADGRVLVQAQGNVDVDAVGSLEIWLQRGPARATVTQIEAIEIETLVSEKAFRIL